MDDINILKDMYIDFDNKINLHNILVDEYEFNLWEKLLDIDKRLLEKGYVIGKKDGEYKITKISDFA